MTAREKKLRAAMAEVKRFGAAAEKALVAAIEVDGGGFPDVKHFAAAKRASMDLTRALADLRRPG